MIDVQRFFKQRHPDSYKIYNLCSERAYDPAKFDGRCSRYPFDDHNPCPFDLLQKIMKDVHKHLHPLAAPGGKSEVNRVVAIHCKAGKGRTGLIVVCYLLYAGYFKDYDPNLALRFYAIRRTKNQKGVTIPSQIRWVHYYARFLRMERGLFRFPEIPPRNPVLLQSIRLFGIPRPTLNKDVWFKLVLEASGDGGAKYTSKGRVTPVRHVGEDYLTFQAPKVGTGITAVDQDVQITFFTGGLFETTKLFSFWFSTRFLGLGPESNEAPKVMSLSEALAAGRDEEDEPLTLSLVKHELDKACKDVHHKIFIESFRVELTFTSV